MPPRKRTTKEQPSTEDLATEEVTELDTSKFVDPNADASKEDTPLAYLKDVPEVDVTHFDEDDDPLTLVGDLDGDGDVDEDDKKLADA